MRSFVPTARALGLARAADAVTADSSQESEAADGSGATPNRYFIVAHPPPQAGRASSNSSFDVQLSTCTASLDRIISKMPTGVEVVHQLRSEWIERRLQGEGYGRGVRSYSRGQAVFAPHAMSGVDDLHRRGVKGKGTHVCVIDTGADYKNPILGGGFGPGYKLTTGYDFVGDDGQSPSNDPYTECDKHATHILGIIGANENPYGFLGVAPEATLGLYRIFACRQQGGQDDTLVQAMLRAEADGCQVISMSFEAGNSDWGDDYPPRTVMNGLSAKGIIFLASSGNSGAAGLFSAQDPAIVSSVLSVGSVDVTAFARVFPLSFDDSSLKPVGYLSVLPIMLNDSMPLYFVTQSEKLDLNNPACASLPATIQDLSKKITVVQLTPQCDLTSLQIHLTARNARYVIVHDIANRPVAAASFYVPGIDQGTYFLGMSKDDGLRLLSYYKTDPSLRVNFRTRMPLAPLPNPSTGGLISAYSSHGPSNSLASPGTHIVAPGGSILSTLPMSMGSIGIISGTSMSIPFVAGVTALLLSSPSKKGLSSDQLRALLATTAKSVMGGSTKGDGRPASVLVQGGGLVSAPHVFDAKTLVEPYFLAMNDFSSHERTRSIKLTNHNLRAVTYVFKNLPAETLALFNESVSSDSLIPASPPCLVKSAQVSFSPTKLTVPAAGSASFQVTITSSSLYSNHFPFYSGTISIQGDDPSQQRFQVPYFGLAAKLADAPVLSTSLASTSRYGSEGLRYPFVSVGYPSSNALVLGRGQGSNVTTCKRSDGLTIVYRLLRESKLLCFQSFQMTPTTFYSSVPTRALYVDLVSANTTQRPTIPGRRSPASATRLSGSSQQPSQDRRPFDATSTLGRIYTTDLLDRDHLPTNDRQISFNGGIPPATLDSLGASSLPKQLATGQPARILLRALRLNADPGLESSYDSFLSAAFQFSD
ncbi:BZ3500_MvSof-1268-A1-R1_Chr9g10566 [Microbotryum saponariae]|uniref:BZ3500_MvSof-1268-A1-R1_Chr9g10566 protein n=1 Tax=Microbotryum saponariae TaxID=289078 RepID=A0A2X0K985_9BASI|nr:BZ3501_MvSof-1269-A2-R1_Chr9g10315 [Microbotryum saponariae]SDA00308.1 BZ3500_MvSof-1268-A1-R1_Chr9g10566 [Microbotryum saponariae]